MSNEDIVAFWYEYGISNFVNLASGNALLPDGTKPLYYQSEPSPRDY